MPTVTERHGFEIDDAGNIVYDESPSTFERADKVAGKRVDRRRNYMIIDGELCESTEWTQVCSGCNGWGCTECRGRGKVRQAMWCPMPAMEASRRD